MFCGAETLTEPTFDTFSFKKEPVFNMFSQMYQAIMRMDATMARMEAQLLQVSRKQEEYGVANVVELLDDDEVGNNNEQARRKLKVVSKSAGRTPGSVNTTRAFGVLESKKCTRKKNGVSSDDEGSPVLENDDLAKNKSDVKNSKLNLDSKDLGSGVKMLESKPVGVKIRPNEVFSLLEDTTNIVDKEDPLFHYSPHNKDFRIQGKQLYLTYPQSGELTRELVLEQVEKEFGDIDQYVACFELHKDGGRHIHAYIKLLKKVSRRGAPRWLDIDGHHPNIESRIRSLAAVIKYVTKGGDYISKNLDVDYILSPEGRSRNGVRARVAADLIEGVPILDVVHAYKTPLIGLNSLQRDLDTYLSLKSDNALAVKKLEKFKIANLEFEFKGTHKEKQFWIFGPPNVGKTTMVEGFMNEGYIGFRLPDDNNFHGWTDNVSYAYAKEFAGGVPFHVMTDFLEGGSSKGACTKLRVKFGQAIKKVNIPTFIECNLMPHQVYKNMPRVLINALSVRINLIEIFPKENGELGWSHAKIIPHEDYMKMLDGMHFGEWNGC